MQNRLQAAVHQILIDARGYTQGGVCLELPENPLVVVLGQNDVRIEDGKVL
ncbi:MAG: hypothetical protein NTZ17_11365 [Phycisphaerae bacterium]|nr:hypothetical protein [Phycisphaerae bacterium]